MAEFIDRRPGTAAVSSRADRHSSFELADFPLPTGREEEWRFTPLKRIEAVYADELAGKAPAVKVNGNELAFGEVETYSLGEKDSQVSLHRQTCSGLGTVSKPSDRSAAAGWVNRDEIVHLYIAKEEELSEPLFVDFTGTSDIPAAQHVVVELAPFAKATVVFKHSGQVKLNQTVEVILNDEAKLDLVSIQNWDYDSTHAANHRMRVGANATLKHTVVTLGGDLVRICSDVEYQGEGGEAELLGVYFTDSKQHHEHRLFVNHNEANCVSNVNYKGALQGQDTHAVWIGDVLIGAKAFGTDSYEQNRNLILTQGAKADSVPNLEIENGDIAGAGHASATGRFDEEQLFYLQSRGIPEELARKLVVHGFFGELIHQIGIESVENELMEAIEAELEKGNQL